MIFPNTGQRFRWPFCISRYNRTMNDQVREVKEKTDIVALIGEHVTLKKAGRHWKGLCPFHNEKTPSFTVSPELQLYKCFGCGKSGDVFTFLEEYEGLEFPDALKVLAQKAGVELIQTKGVEGGKKEILYEVNDLAAKFYHYVLMNLASGKDSLTYFIDKRGLTKDTIEAFLLGAAPESPHALFDFLARKKNISPETLVEAGLVFKTDRGDYIDRFRGRAIFPIQNARGATIALAGRILPGPMEKKLAKYINSPETPIYHKSESLFGLPQSRAEIKRTKAAVVVEGEVDMISSWQHGVKNVVAIKGSAFTDSHARVLSRLATSVILALDADFAGGNAAMKGISEAQKFGLEVKVANLGEYKDPDEFARADELGYQKALSTSVNVWDFLVELMFSRYSIDTAQGKLELSRALIPYLSHIEDPILQAHYVRLVAGRLSVPESAVMSSLKSVKQEIPVVEISAPKQDPEVKDTSRRAKIEERLLLLVALDDAHSLPKISESVFLSSKGKRLFASLTRFSKEHPTDFQFKNFVSSLPPELSFGFVDSFLEDDDSERKVDGKEIGMLLRELTEMSIKEEIKALSVKIKSLDMTHNETEISALQAKIGELTKLLAQNQQGDYTA